VLLGLEDLDMNATRDRRRRQHAEPALPFDLTQEIDPALAELLRRSSEPTLTQSDFDDLAVELPPPARPRR
jgi:hypothetical protein